MLTNLDFLNEGQSFPPDCEKERLEMYRNNRKLFEGKHASVYHEDLKRIERVIGNFNDIISYPIVLNFQKLMSVKIADFLFGEPPTFSIAESAGEAQGATLKALTSNTELLNVLYMAALDISRYGDALLDIQDEKIGLSQPLYWFPVVSEDDIKIVKHHVLAWTIGADDNQQLKVRIHSVGFYEERLYYISGATIGGMISKETIQTRLSDFKIVQVSNLTTSDRATGLDDYTDVDSIIGELMVRIGQVSRILDKHASPSMDGPASALERDPRSGEVRLKAGNFFPRNDTTDPELRYITWDGQLTSAFTQIEKLINLLYTISEMGSAVFGDMIASSGNVPSGSALRRLLISPLAKTNRIRLRMSEQIKKALALCSELGGEGIVKIKAEDISVKWADGLPGDPTEESLIMTQRTGQKATMSQYRALKTYDGMTDDDAEEELSRIQDEEAAMNPMASPPPFAQTDNSGEEAQKEDDSVDE